MNTYTEEIHDTIVISKTYTKTYSIYIYTRPLDLDIQKERIIIQSTCNSLQLILSVCLSPPPSSAFTGKLKLESTGFESTVSLPGAMQF